MIRNDEKVQGTRYIIDTKIIQLYKNTLLSKGDISPPETIRLLFANIIWIP